MTNLTKQEIEKERVKFEEWFKKNQGDCIRNHWNEKLGCYVFYPMHLGFMSWIARAELAKKEEYTTKFQIGRVTRHLRSVQDIGVSEHQALVSRVKSAIGVLDNLN